MDIPVGIVFSSFALTMSVVAVMHAWISAPGAPKIRLESIAKELYPMSSMAAAAPTNSLSAANTPLTTRNDRDNGGQDGRTPSDRALNPGPGPNQKDKVALASRVVSSVSDKKLKSALSQSVVKSAAKSKSDAKSKSADKSKSAANSATASNTTAVKLMKTGISSLTSMLKPKKDGVGVPAPKPERKKQHFMNSDATAKARAAVEKDMSQKGVTVEKSTGLRGFLGMKTDSEKKVDVEIKKTMEKNEASEKSKTSGVLPKKKFGWLSSKKGGGGHGALRRETMRKLSSA